VREVEEDGEVIAAASFAAAVLTGIMALRNGSPMAMPVERRKVRRSSEVRGMAMNGQRFVTQRLLRLFLLLWRHLARREFVMHPDPGVHGHLTIEPQLALLHIRSVAVNAVRIEQRRTAGSKENADVMIKDQKTMKRGIRQKRRSGDEYVVAALLFHVFIR
jgi:hypothetical protein